MEFLRQKTESCSEKLSANTGNASRDRIVLSSARDPSYGSSADPPRRGNVGLLGPQGAESGRCVLAREMLKSKDLPTVPGTNLPRTPGIFGAEVEIAVSQEPR